MAQAEFDPDLVTVRMDQIGGAKFTEPPLPAQGSGVFRSYPVLCGM